jgi:hypothetical protein
MIYLKVVFYVRFSLSIIPGSLDDGYVCGFKNPTVGINTSGTSRHSTSRRYEREYANRFKGIRMLVVIVICLDLEEEEVVLYDLTHASTPTLLLSLSSKQINLLYSRFTQI